MDGHHCIAAAGSESVLKISIPPDSPKRDKQKRRCQFDRYFPPVIVIGALSGRFSGHFGAKE
jgi:hypothetical protein